MNDRLLTYKDLAARWQFSVNTLRQKVMRKELVPIKLGRAVRFKESYIESIENGGLFHAGQKMG